MDDRDTIIAGLRAQLQKANDEIGAAKLEAAKAKSEQKQFAAGVRAFQQVLQPLYDAIRQIFGEMPEVIGGDTATSPTGAASSGLSPKWEMLKARLGGRQAEIIDLLQHGEMNAIQLRAAAHWDIKTVYRITAQMQQGGLLTKSGGKFSLREL